MRLFEVHESFSANAIDSNHLFHTLDDTDEYSWPFSASNFTIHTALSGRKNQMKKKFRSPIYGKEKVPFTDKNKENGWFLSPMQKGMF